MPSKDILQRVLEIDVPIAKQRRQCAEVLIDLVCSDALSVHCRLMARPLTEEPLLGAASRYGFGLFDAPNAERVVLALVANSCPCGVTS